MHTKIVLLLGCAFGIESQLCAPTRSILVVACWHGAYRYRQALMGFPPDFPTGSHCNHYLVSVGVILTFMESHLVLLCAELLLKMLITWLPPLIQLVRKCDVCKSLCIVLSKLLIFLPQSIFASNCFSDLELGKRIHRQAASIFL